MTESSKQICKDVLETVLHLTWRMPDPISFIVAQRVQNNLLLKRLAKLAGLSRHELQQRSEQPCVAIPLDDAEAPTAESKPSAGEQSPGFHKDDQHTNDNESEADEPSANESGAIEHQHSQSLRDQTYCAFNGEAEENYTQGPARLVMASDGVQACTALLIRMDLSQLIQRAAQTRRTLAQKRRRAERQGDEMDEFKYTVLGEISSHRIRLAAETEVLPGDEPKEADPEVLASLQRQMGVLERILERISLKKSSLHDGLRGLELSLAKTQGDILLYLEEAFEDATLIPEQVGGKEESIEKFDLQAEYHATAKDMYHDQDSYASAGPLETGDDFSRPKLTTPTPEEQAIAAHHDAVRKTRDGLNTAQMHFNRKEYDQDLDKKHNLAAYETWTEFDTYWVQRNREITHELVEAEEAYKEAKATAIEAGIRKEDVSSECGTLLDNGCALSGDVDQARIDARRYIVDEWMAKVPDDATPKFQNEIEVDDWEGEEVDISDSISCVDRYIYREAIDRWRQQRAPSIRE